MSASVYSDFADPGEGTETPIEILPEPAESALEAQPASATEPSAEPPAPAPRRRRGRKRILLLLVVFAAGLGWYFRGGSSSFDSRALAFLPDQPAVVVRIQVDRLEGSSLFAQLKATIGGLAQQHAPPEVLDVVNQLEGAMQAVCFATTAPATPAQLSSAAASGVIHFSKDFPVEELVPAEFRAQLKREQSGDHTIVIFNDAAYCQVDPRTIAFGNPQGVREIVKREFRPAELSDAMQEALAVADFEQAVTMVAAGPAQAAAPFKQFVGVEPPRAIVLTADVDTDIQITTSLVMQSAADIPALQNRAQPFLEMAKLQSPEAAKVLDSLDFSASGNTLIASMEIPGKPLLRMVEQQVSQWKNVPFPGAPAVPGAGRGVVSKIRGAAHNVCQQNKAAINVAIERYYVEKGEWPSEVSQLSEYLGPDVPAHCEAHHSMYAIDPKRYRVTEVSLLDQAVTSMSTRQTESAPAAAGVVSAEDIQRNRHLVRRETPEAAFAFIEQAARDGDVERLLEGFTKAGRLEIAGDLVDTALQDVALGSHNVPGVAQAFRELKDRQAPELEQSDTASYYTRQLEYLKSISRFMQEHQIQFAGLAKMYRPCVLGEVVAETDWAIGNVTHSEGDVQRETTLGFSRRDGHWTICVLGEIPSPTRDRLESRLHPAEATEAGG